jgi:hypothetical protein
MQAWNRRYDFATCDIIAYLDVADAYLHGDWGSVVNGNWSPLYSWLLALAQTLLGFPPFWDACRVKLVNFLIFLFSLACFRYFLHHLLQFHDQKSGPTLSRALPRGVVLAAGYGLYLWSALRWIGLSCDTPDLCTAGLVYLAYGLLLRAQTRPAHGFHYAGFGAILGLGYLSKAAMLPLAPVFLVAALVGRSSLRQVLSRLVPALAGLILVAGPYVAALSLTKGRLTFSDTGKLSYIWYVNPTCDVIPWAHWQGEPPEYGTPLHTTRKRFADPDLFEFAGPVGGTYPPWTDPTYWNDGLRIRLDLGKQKALLAKNVSFYWSRFFKVLLLSFALLAAVGGRPGQSVCGLAACWRILTPALAGLGLYALSTDFPVNSLLLQPSTRFIASFLVLFFATTVASVQLAPTLLSRRLVLALLLGGLLLAGGKLGHHVRHDLKAVCLEKQENVHAQVAETLYRLGLRPGDPIAILGDNEIQSYGARLARLKIIAQADDKVFWSKDARRQAEFLQAVEALGAEAVMMPADILPTPTSGAADWHQLGIRPYFVHVFKRRLSASTAAPSCDPLVSASR